jgi:GTPase
MSILERAPHLPPESEDDGCNVEYKWRVNGKGDAFERRVSQLVWRMAQGAGEALIEVGYHDDGSPVGLPEEALEASLAMLQRLAEAADAEASVVRRMAGTEGICAEVLVRRAARTGAPMIEVRIALAGNVDSGKSTLSGVLTRGGLDNGRGAARLSSFNHAHEVSTGRTSSISRRILGFDATGRVVNYNEETADAGTPGSLGPLVEVTEVAARAAKMVTLTDLCGHERYLKTTVAGLAHSPDYVLLVVGANNGVQKMTREHLGLAFAMRIPVIVVLTKCDSLTPDNVKKESLAEIRRVVKGAGKRMLYPVRSADDAVRAAGAVGGSFVTRTPGATLLEEEEEEEAAAVSTEGETGVEVEGTAEAGEGGPAVGAASSPGVVPRHAHSDMVLPLFQVSAVTGMGLDLLRRFLNLLPPRGNWTARVAEKTQIVIDANFHVVGVGTVASGIVEAGAVHLGDTLLLGPDSNGRWQPVPMRSLHVRRSAVKTAYAGQEVGIALKKIKRPFLRRGMALVDPALRPCSVLVFDADIVILSSHSTTIKLNYQPVVQAGVVRQAAAVQELARPLLRAGDRGRVRFRFIRRPEYVRVGDRLVFREGRCRGIGVIRAVYDMHSTEELPPLSR